MTFPSFLGVPEEDALVNSIVRKHGFKVIGANEELAANPEFLELRKGFSQNYNVRLYEFYATNRNRVD
jgi:hypothetical protein